MKYTQVVYFLSFAPFFGCVELPGEARGTSKPNVSDSVLSTVLSLIHPDEY
jgi:hypothetical protein